MFTVKMNFHQVNSRSVNFLRTSLKNVLRSYYFDQGYKILDYEDYEHALLWENSRKEQFWKDIRKEKSYRKRPNNTYASDT